MKYSLFLIGDGLIENQPMCRYIDRHFARFGITPERRFLFREPQRFFPERAGDTERAETCFILCDPFLAPLVAREIATLTGDTLIIRDECLVPSRSSNMAPTYYHLNDGTLHLHVMQVESGGELPSPELTLPPSESAVVHLFESDETALMPVLKQIAESYRVDYALTAPIPGWLQCRLEAERFGDVDGALQHLLTRFPSAVASDNIALWLIEVLQDAGKTVTFAESCTGGLLSYYLTKESGASGVFEGGLITYSNRLKSEWIAVENATLEAHGAVSREVVEAMSAGALEVSGADYAVAVSGVAGPTGGTPQKPVGTVQVAVRSNEAVTIARLQLSGDRNYIQEQTVLYAVKMLMLLDKKTFFKIY
ncbi:CinA family protein [Sulfurimonas sp. HSL-3221]|uniref:CinA family protein n=1 Tax=Thiomicrolovo sulfuroxydans TaxID=2894755 RepID=UPI001E400D03|nr:CinA family protein [Sulfurimonas sp. HSL-3221]UFS61771.1 CinA family protein [Sulfurimonas sp. HSL-3221]